MKILGISGSLRRGSYNTALLRVLAEILDGKAEVEVYVPGDLPLYNEDIDGDSRPGPVEAFRSRIEAADALLVATPEYNHGIPGALKNAIDWASRPAFRSPLIGLPAGILSAAKSPVGGARAQGVLRQVLASTLVPIFPHVEMLVASAHEQLDEELNLTNAKIRERLERFGDAFVEWVDRSGR